MLRYAARVATEGAVRHRSSSLPAHCTVQLWRLMRAGLTCVGYAESVGTPLMGIVASGALVELGLGFSS